MVKKLLIPSLVLVLAVMACSLPGNITIDLGDGGVTAGAPGADGVIPDPVLPPPATATFLQVVYSKGGNLLSWWDDGAITQLSATGQDTQPQLSRTRSMIAYKHANELWVMNSDGSNPHVVVSSLFLSGVVPPSDGWALLNWFQWDPLYDYVYFGTSIDTEVYTIPASDLWVVPSDASTPPFMTFAAGQGGPVTFSPDGVYYTITQPTRIRLLNRDASVQRDALTFPPVLTYSEWSYLPEVVWFDGSTEFRTVIPAHDPLTDPLEGTYFWSVPVSGTPIDMAGFTASPAFMSTPRISPDGFSVAYMEPNGGNTDLHLNGFYIGNEIFSSYTAGSWDLVGWAPDSTRFIYWIDDRENLWLASIGNPGIRLTDTAQAGDVRWVDDARILFLSGQDLRFGFAGGVSNLIDSGVDGGYDYYSFSP